MIRMAITVPLALPEQLALERATHAVLDADHAGEWTVTLVPFMMMMPGGMLEVSAGRDCGERRLLDKVDAGELERALRRVLQRANVPDGSGPNQPQ